MLLLPGPRRIFCHDHSIPPSAQFSPKIKKIVLPNFIFLANVFIFLTNFERKWQKLVSVSVVEHGKDIWFENYKREHPTLKKKWCKLLTVPLVILWQRLSNILQGLSWSCSTRLDGWAAMSSMRESLLAALQTRLSKERTSHMSQI